MHYPTITGSNAPTSPPIIGHVEGGGRAEINSLIIAKFSNLALNSPEDNDRLWHPNIRLLLNIQLSFEAVQ